MSEAPLDITESLDIRNNRSHSDWTANDWLAASVQPTLVLGSMFLVASMVANDWIYRELFAAIMIVLPIPLCFVGERIWTKRKDWLLEPKEMLEDVGWLAAGAFIWVPLYSNFYETPISEGFKALRDTAPLRVTLEPTTIIGYLGCAMLVMLISSFIYYWLHRVQHESLFWWRIHATHHHITKMGCMRGDRTHPLEWATLLVATPTALALMGASDGVMAVAGAFGIWSGTLNHSNLPLKSMPVYDWLFATAQQHHVHHAHLRRQADSNYGCNLIIWDRVFGTYCGDDYEGQIGAGKAVPLSVKDQLALAFYSDKRLKSL
ncbi:MAG: sterol desaturase family protein [Proteobacteria bacterium]|nr:sterol desaturase family protein [Pseudomonadota bacterium]MDA0928023.1 sterol desaturase family protein [Pseudomonadota bacterium]